MPVSGLSVVVPVDDLQFDKENPRFADAEEQLQFDDKSIVEFYRNEVDLMELVNSITASGYIDFDPMLVIRNGKKFTVLEGNRRLAALKVLRNPELAAAVGISDTKMRAADRKSIDKISVRIMKNKSDSRAYIGFKHINGPHKWDSMAKAKYASEWIKDGATLDQVAKTLGDQNFLVRRLIFGYLVLKQAINNGFDIEDRYTKRFAFSHLYTGLTRPGFREYLGLNPDDLNFKTTGQPIPRAHVRQLMDVMEWLYGSRKRNILPVIRSQNPDLNRLNEVLQRPQSRRSFMSSKSLDEAVDVLEPKSRRFSDALLRALSNTETATALVVHFDGSTLLLETAQTLLTQAKFLLESMQGQKKGKRRA